MKKSVVFSALVLGVLLSSSLTLAADPFRGPMANTRSGPENFGPAGGDFCNSPNLPFGAAPSTVSDTIAVSGEGTVANLEVDLQIAHTWVGDITATLSHGANSSILVQRPGQPMSGCGCSFDDIDVTLSAAGTGSVENACSPAPPAVGGTLTPSPGLITAFDGTDANGNWTMTIADAFPGSDDGTFGTWCLTFGAGGTGGTTGGGTTGGGTSTPATSTWGVIVLIALFLGASLFFLRRKGSVNA